MAAFALLTVLLWQGRLLGVDVAVADWSAAHRPPVAYWTARVLNSLGQGGWFLMPATLHHRTEAEWESKRRALFRRRAELRWEAVKLLNNALRPVPWWRDAMEATASMESLPTPPDVTRAA